MGQVVFGVVEAAAERTGRSHPPHLHEDARRVARAVLQLQYELARLPIGALDVWVLGRYLPETSALRLPFGRVLGSLAPPPGGCSTTTPSSNAAPPSGQRATAPTTAALLDDDAPRPGGPAWGQQTAVPQNPPGRRDQGRRDHRTAIAEDQRDGRADQRRVTAQARADTVRDFARAAADDRLRGVEARRSADRTRIDTRGE